MLKIDKLTAPEGLLEYLNIELQEELGIQPTYTGFTNFRKEKDENGQRILPNEETPFYQLRMQLLQEQKYLCAYCGQELLVVENENNVPQMKTEHFVPQNDVLENDLNYQNLLGCCLGRDNMPGENHCDSMKGNATFKHLENPAIINFRDKDIVYRVNKNAEEVLVFSVNDAKNFELTGIKDEKTGKKAKENHLNLNHDVLKKGRYMEWKNVLSKTLGDDKSTWDFDKVKEIIADYSDINSTHNKKFKDFILWYLEDWMAKQAITT
jgi:uncharacterized protein (TIGR02646 family)